MNGSVAEARSGPNRSGIAFVDTNIFVYAYDKRAGDKHLRAISLIADLSGRGELVLSAQVLNELTAVLLRPRGEPRTIEDILQIVEETAAFGDVVPLTGEMTRAALGAVERHTMSFWDALLWAACKAHGIGCLYTEDFQHDRDVEGVLFVNPFLEGSAGKSGDSQGSEENEEAES